MFYILEMDRLNYHHLRYFREVAHEGNLTRVAERLNVSQSALSTQIRQLEGHLGHALFDRKGRSLLLTEAGQLTLEHADLIFQAGGELLATLRQEGGPIRPLRVGALSTLSRNFQLRFLRPVLDARDCPISLISGDADSLMAKLHTLALDVVLSTEAPSQRMYAEVVAHRVSEQSVGLYGTRKRVAYATLADMLRNEPIILPTESSIRTGFDSLAARLGLSIKVAAEVDDMAMVRLLAREDAGLAIVPAVVLADELSHGILHPAPFPLDITETFYAVTVKRRFQHPLLPKLLDLTPPASPGTPSTPEPDG